MPTIVAPRQVAHIADTLLHCFCYRTDVPSPGRPSALHFERQCVRTSLHATVTCAIRFPTHRRACTCTSTVSLSARQAVLTNCSNNISAFLLFLIVCDSFHWTFSCRQGNDAQKCTRHHATIATTQLTIGLLHRVLLPATESQGSFLRPIHRTAYSLLDRYQL